MRRELQPALAAGPRSAGKRKSCKTQEAGQSSGLEES